MSTFDPAPPGGPGRDPGRAWSGVASPPARRGSQTLARCAIWFSLVPCGLLFVVGAVLAVVALAQGAPGRGKAIGALVVSGAWVVVFAVVFVLAALDEPDDAPGGRRESLAAGHVRATDLRPGDCLVDAADTPYRPTVEVVPCGQSHRSEVFADPDLTGRWPGVDRVGQQAQEQCRSLLPTRLLERRRMTVFVYYPAVRPAWEADPGLTCVVDLGAERLGRLVPVP